MASARDIRQRIKSVKNIQQITKSMKMVAAARFRRAQEKANASQPYTESIMRMLASVAASAAGVAHPLLEVREIKRTGYLILSADRGLAGAYSSSLMREVVPQVQGRADIGLITVGRKPRDYFKRRGYKIDREYFGISEKPAYQDAIMLAKAMAEGFLSGEYDEIYLAFTKFHSPMSHKPTTIKLLPMENTADMQTKLEYIFEPSASKVLNYLVPKYLETVIYGALLQSAASELGARMTAMSSATDNAEELIAKLIINYNKVRQATITREISEIVGGVEALR